MVPLRAWTLAGSGGGMNQRPGTIPIMAMRINTSWILSRSVMASVRRAPFASPGVAVDDGAGIAPLKKAAIRLAPVAVHAREHVLRAIRNLPAAPVEFERRESVRRNFVDCLDRRLAAMVVPAQAISVALELEELVLDGFAAQRPLGGPAVVVDLRRPELEAGVTQPLRSRLEFRQVFVHEPEIGVAVPGDRPAVAHAAEQQAHDHPVPAVKLRVGEQIV